MSEHGREAEDAAALERWRPAGRRAAHGGRLCVSRARLGEELQRVDQLAVREDFVVQVRAGRAAGGADIADDVAALARCARLDVEAAQVPVARRQTEVVLEDDQVAVVARVAADSTMPSAVAYTGWPFRSRCRGPGGSRARR